MAGDIGVALNDPLEHDGSSRKVYLSFEVLLMIFGYSRKQDLKSIRLSCTDFSSLATGLLFDRVFITPYKKDLKIFTEIAKSPHLCRSVNTIIYGAERFHKEIDQASYLDLLMHQLIDRFRWESKDTFIFDNQDHEAKRFLNYLQQCGRADRKTNYVHMDWLPSRIISRGFSTYANLVKEQQGSHTEREVAIHFCLGFERFLNLRTVEFASAWPAPRRSELPHNQTLQPRHLSGSPLARSWHPLHLEPSTFVGCDSVGLTSVISSLGISGGTIDVLNCSAGAPNYTFNSREHEGSSFISHATEALQRLKSFTISLHRVRKHCPMDLMPRVLHSMASLRSLTISSDEPEPASELVSIVEVFGLLSPRWSHLSYLDLTWFKCSQHELLDVLCNQPELRILKLTGIELVIGEWKSVVDKLHSQLKLDSFTLDAPIRNSAGTDLWDDDTEEGPGFAMDIQHYVIYGGRNPLIDHPLGFLGEEDANDDA